MMCQLFLVAPELMRWLPWGTVSPQACTAKEYPNLCIFRNDSSGIRGLYDPTNDMVDAYAEELVRELEGRQPLAVARLPVAPWTRAPQQWEGT
jgi:hypothetical protein